MIQLFLDTSNCNLIVSLYKDDEKLYELIENTDNKVSNTLLAKVDFVLKQTKIDIKDIKEIYVVTGPGSFTGIRIGLTFAKVTAYLLNIKVIAVSELELLASGSQSEYTLSLIDARRNYVYAGLYDKNGKNILKDQYIYLDELMNIINTKYKDLDINIVSYDTFANLSCNVPNLDIKTVISRHKADDYINPHMLNPNYLKKTEAEEKLNA